MEQAKAEMQMSVDLLREKGSKPFDLPTYWLREEDNDSNDSDDSDSDSDSSSSSSNNSDLSSGRSSDGDGSNNMTNSNNSNNSGRDSQTGDGSGRGNGGDNGSVRDGDSDSSEGTAKVSTPKTGRSRRAITTTRGHFAFFLADQAPFLVGQITDVRRAEGDGEEREAQHEVRIHWWSPATARIRAAAASVSLDTYAKGVFAKDHVPWQGSGGNRRRLIPDQSWEPVSRIVTTCPALIGRGKKIPGKILKVLAEDLEIGKTKKASTGSGGSASSSEDDSSDGEEHGRIER